MGIDIPIMRIYARKVQLLKDLKLKKIKNPESPQDRNFLKIRRTEKERLLSEEKKKKKKESPPGGGGVDRKH